MGFFPFQAPHLALSLLIYAEHSDLWRKNDIIGRIPVSGILFRRASAFKNEYTAGGFVWRLGSSIYLGYNQDESQGLSSSKEIELQWGGVVIGFHSEEDGIENSQAFLAWEPEKDGFAVVVATMDSKDVNFKSGSAIRVGYIF